MGHGRYGAAHGGGEPYGVLGVEYGGADGPKFVASLLAALA